MTHFGSIWLKTGQFSPLLINSDRVGSGNLYKYFHKRAPKRPISTNMATISL